MNLLDTAIKGIFFSVCLFFLITITGTGINEASIVELKAFFVLNGTFITVYEKCYRLSPLIL